MLSYDHLYLSAHCTILPHTALSRSELLLHCTVWNVHCCGVHCTTSWYKCSALNSGASLNRGRKFMTGISSRHESWQKIRHIPHPPHISTLSPALKNPGKNFKNTLCCIFWRGQETVGKMPWDFSGAVVVVTGALYKTTLSISHRGHLYWLLKVTTRVKAEWDPQTSRPISLADYWNQLRALDTGLG